MILYTEANLDLAWREDCKFRAKINEPWLEREEYRRRFEAELDDYIAGLSTKFSIIIPSWILETIDAEFEEWFVGIVMVKLK